MRPPDARRTLNDAKRTAQRALLLAEAGRKLMDAEDEDRLTAQLFASAGELVPLPHWWRNHFDAQGAAVTTHWTPSLLDLFPAELITAPLRTESLHVDLNRRLHREKATIPIPRCDLSLRYHNPGVDAHPLRSYLAIPLIYRDEIVGALIGGSFGDEGERDLDPMDIQALEHLVGTATQAILRIRAQRSLARSQALERGQRELLAMVAQARELPEVLEGLAAFVSRMGTDLRSAVWLLEEGQPIATAGSLDAFTERPHAVDACARTCGPVVAFDPEPCWAWPILNRMEAPVGVLAVRPMEPRSPHPEERELLEAAARIAALACEHRAMASRLTHQAHHDALTGLPNRVLLEDRLTQALAQARRNDQRVALLFIDLDGFKGVNDSLGHPAGDALLRLVADRLAGSVRASDTLARMGGDEFAVVLQEVRDTPSAARVAEKLLESLRLPFRVEGRDLHISASIGVAFFPEDGVDAETLLRHADVAMYRAKALGRDACQCFTPELQDQMEARLDLDRRLDQALQEGEFTLHYQPQFHPDGRLTGFEALVRWNHPSLGLVPPAKFIPAAEESGLILPLGRWVLEEACRQMVRWRQAGARDLVMAVNVSAIQFADPGWVDTVAQVIDRHGLPPHCLELELTESLVMDPASEPARRLARLKEMGVGLAIDDFGTGYSSLSYLHRLPISVLKIDQSFVRELQPGREDRSGPILQAIVALGRHLGLQVVAEGVETELQRAFLANLGCDALQGYLLGRPVPPEALEALVRQAALREPARLPA
ncbi:MAG TPA: EAL domain-containing protein [Holophagaceae bacterium]|nr:EAL domain-containing protein [Holophagaceae bacterium]